MFGCFGERPQCNCGSQQDAHSFFGSFALLYPYPIPAIYMFFSSALNPADCPAEDAEVRAELLPPSVSG